MITFTQLIERCNEFLWVHQYPNHNMEPASLQHRDLVRTFMAGVLEALMLVDQTEQVESLLKDYEPMIQENWLPDTRFFPKQPPAYTRN